MWVKFSDFTPVQVYGTYWMRTDAMPRETAHAVELYRNGGDWLVKSPDFCGPSKPELDWLFWDEPLQPPHPATLPSEPSHSHSCFCCPIGYEPLHRVLKDALARAAKGKGAERHASDEPFIDQPIFTIPRALGGSPDPLLFQAVKKIYESKRLDPDAARNELLDAIVYLASAIILTED